MEPYREKRMVEALRRKGREVVLELRTERRIFLLVDFDGIPTVKWETASVRCRQRLAIKRQVKLGGTTSHSS